MKKLIIYGALLAAALMVPTRATELGKMKPIETVCIYHNDRNEIVIETDTEDIGRGMTVKDALYDLKETTAGVIYLDTADYLLVKEGAEQHISELVGYLKETVLLCGAEGDVSVKDAALYLSNHKPAVRINEWESGMKLEVLKEDEGRMRLIGK